MFGLISRLFGKNDAALTDASRIYKNLMLQARQPAFYGENKIADSYDGRIELLTLHQSAILYRLKSFGDQGQRLSQAIYDVMRDDFEIAMREEGLSDTGIKRRIKPMVALFLTRAKAYDAALVDGGDLKSVITDGILGGDDTPFAESLTQYMASFVEELGRKSLGQIAMAEFDYPAIDS